MVLDQEMKLDTPAFALKLDNGSYTFHSHSTWREFPLCALSVGQCHYHIDHFFQIHNLKVLVQRVLKIQLHLNTQSLN